MEQMMETRSGALAVLAQQGALLKRNLQGPVPIEARRIALERMITLEFPHCGAFFAEYSANISMTGMFIRTDRFQPPGTRAAFELSLADGEGLIRGEAEVVWVRERHEGSDRPAGLGLRFVRLEEDGRRQIRRAVEKRQREGRASLEQSSATTVGRNGSEDRDVPSADRVDSPAPRSERESNDNKLRSYAGARAAQATDGRWRWMMLGVSAAVIAVAWVFIHQGVVRAEGPGLVEDSKGSTPAVESLGTPNSVSAVESSRPTDTSGLEVGSQSIPTSEGASESVEAKLAPQELDSSLRPDVAPNPQEISDLLITWAESWSTQNVGAYLAFYAESYRPADGMSRAQWSAQRKDRISRPSHIEVEISDLEIQFLGSERVQARFLQSYTSDRYQDQTRKVLDLVVEQGTWKIQQERAEG